MEPAAAATSRTPAAASDGRATALRAARLLVGGALFAAVVVVTIRQWRDVSDTVGEIGPTAIAGALVLALLGLAASALTWRAALAELGSRAAVPAALKIYLVGQLGKYIPGSVWALVVQMELARAAAIRRTSALGASIVAIVVNVVTGGALGLAVQPLLGDRSVFDLAVAAAGLLGCAVCIAPPVLGRVIDLGLRVAGQPPLARRPRWAGIVTAAGFSLTSWLAYGLALGLLAVGAGGDPAESFAVALPAVALAMTIGFLVVVAPSGLGVREAVLVATLAPVLDASTALGVALALRLVFTIADLIAAATSLALRSSAVRP
jgi:glycosyltransferase 2 family protein